MSSPPLQLAVDVQSPDGTVHARWGPDEPKATNAPSNLTFSTTMPGGFEQMSCTLPREPDLEYADLAEFSTVTVYGPGGQTAWQGRLETTPRVSGDQMNVTPGAVGWQAHLDDDQSAKMIYIDCDFTRWGPASVQRRLNNTASSQDTTDPGMWVDPATAMPALDVGIEGAWSRSTSGEAWYDAKGIELGTAYYAWKLNGNVVSSDTAWTWALYLSSDDLVTAGDFTGNLRSAGPGTGSHAPSATGRHFALVQTFYTGAAGVANIHYAVLWTYLGITGNHNLTIRGTLGATGGIGVLGSDVVQHAVGAFAPKLATSRNGVSTIETSTFVIPQLAFPDPTTASQIIKSATQYGLPDWWVDEGPTFNLASRDNHGRNWHARVGPSGLQETGPQVDRLYNSVIVSYNDVTGVTRTVGPTGSGANTIDDTLSDSDATNPVTVAGLKRRAILQMGVVSTVAGATKVGQDWLAEQKLLSTAGQATIVGTVWDDHGIQCPAWQIRAGDRISFTDAHDTSYRRIVKTSYSDQNRTNQLDLDSPPEGLQALLARLSASLTGTL